MVALIIWWHVVIHDGADGFSRLQVLCASNNNRSDTVLRIFEQAVQ